MIISNILQLIIYNLINIIMLEDHPELENEDIQAALQYAADLVSEEQFFESGTGA